MDDVQSDIMREKKIDISISVIEPMTRDLVGAR